LAFWKGVIDAGVKNVSISTGEVASSGDLAYAVGTLEVTDLSDAKHHSRYVLVFKKVAGEWKLHLDIWTPSTN
jgi:ketosteroid isomerase-like protein